MLATWRFSPNCGGRKVSKTAELEKATAILLSWRRPHNLPPIIEALAGSPRIGEIMLWNNNPEVRLDFPGVTVINSPRNFLCFARYSLVPLAAHDTIWFQDDDLLLSNAQLEAMYAAYLPDPSRIYGRVGRNLVDGLYSADDVYGDCDIVLGQTMLFHRNLLHYAFTPLGALPPDLAEDDIIFSLATARRHLAVEVGPIEDLGMDDGVALWRRPDHFERRQRAVDFMLAWRARGCM
jgi:hypothetical protein